MRNRRLAEKSPREERRYAQWVMSELKLRPPKRLASNRKSGHCYFSWKLRAYGKYSRKWATGSFSFRSAADIAGNEERSLVAALRRDDNEKQGRSAESYP